MGYDISLIDANGDSVQVERFSEGGTQPIGGSTTADISITFNYSKFFHDAIDTEQGIRWIYGKNIDECGGRLSHACQYLGTNRDYDYWKPTAGNAGYVLALLLYWGEKNPTAIFIGD